MPIAGPSMISLLNQAIYEKNSLITGGYRRFCSSRKAALDNSPKPDAPKTSRIPIALSVVSDMNPIKVMSFNVRNTDPADVFTHSKERVTYYR